MRPLRLLLSLSTSLVAFALLLYISLASPQVGDPDRASTPPTQGSFNTLFSFTSPSSLFPPSAIISLTDDNSTFFLARPAAFGPDLPADGLSGPLWIGQGFMDDTISDGEFGCGDIPGSDEDDDFPLDASNPFFQDYGNTESTGQVKDTSTKHGATLRKNTGASHSTDNHLYLSARWTHKAQDSGRTNIPTFQDTSGLMGKIALLKRGQCGFLAKVQWAQNRGASAVIVGDDVRGGVLIRMYAKGDTSNITIPSLFTSYTTAHLLSSLVPAEDTVQEALPGSKAHLDQAGEDSVNQSKTSENWQLPTNEEDSDGVTRLQASDNTGERTAWPHELLSWIGFGRSGKNAPKTRWNEESETKANRRPASAEDSLSTGEAETVVAGGVKSVANSHSKAIKTLLSEPTRHHGLWVTLSPTDVSTSPFFDTLLVLVVSPLVTLTVVYALLLLRSRIRRRRWRAPKSVVERLPVRTYQTISESLSSSTADASSPTTPLLHHSPSQSQASLARPCSEPETELPVTSSSAQRRTRDREGEKRETGLAAWRRRYGGRQKECVVCLEEYEDGVSQVMSLPCGHEFHADCITPWLVTRRRTCPICKGDVVRSLSQSYDERMQSSSPTRLSRFSDDEDGVQAQAAETRNDSPSASQPAPHSMSASTEYSPIGEDVEAGWSNNETRHNARGIPEGRPSELSTSLRELSSTVSTIV